MEGEQVGVVRGAWRGERQRASWGAGGLEMSVRLFQKMIGYPGLKPQTDARAGNKDVGLTRLGMAPNSLG